MRTRSIHRCAPLQTAFSRHTEASQLPEFILFEERLDNSLQRDLTKIEHVRMRITHEPLISDLVDMELIELKFIFDRCAFLPALRRVKLTALQWI